MIQYDLIDNEVRVLGCLIEKDMATPEYYPLSLNALVNACNQKSNRQPVVYYNEETVLQAIDELKEKQLVYQSGAGRVVKYAHNLDKKHNLLPRELAIICLLLLRGQQTPGELRGRSERLYNFNNLDEMSETLNHLVEIQFIQKMDKLPGHKEARYAHLLSGIPQSYQSSERTPGENTTIIVQRKDERMDNLELLVQNLQEEIETLKKEFLKFKTEFE
jgi:hypothetical protein